MPHTRLLDRHREIRRITAWLSESDSRLLTISGPGGCGKTRLVLEALLIRQRVGIETVFVPLADVTESSMIEFAIGKALGITAVFDGDLGGAIAAVVSDGRWVIVLDNAEHLVEAVVDVVVRLHAITPDLSVLVTSRRRLRLDGETVLALGPLTVPEPASDLTAIGAASSVQLFCERVDAVVADFELTAGNAASIAEVCRRLDGLPLAIELAAARCVQVGPVALARELDRAHGLDYLEGALRAVPDRQRTIAALVVWSYDLLEDSTKSVFRALGALSGSWTLEVAEAIIGEQASVIDAVSELVDLNLVELNPERPGHDDDEPRFSMLETVRAEAWSLLVAGAEQHVTLDRIAGYSISVARQTITDNETPRQRAADARVGELLPMLSVAHTRLCGTGRYREACQVSIAVAPLLLGRGSAIEALRWFESAMPESAADDELGVDVAVWRSRLRAEIGLDDTRPLSGHGMDIRTRSAALGVLRVSRSGFLAPGNRPPGTRARHSPAGSTRPSGSPPRAWRCVPGTSTPTGARCCSIGRRSWPSSETIEWSRSSERQRAGNSPG